MKKFYFIDKDYQNESLNNLAKRIAEYNAAELLSFGYDEFAVVSSPPAGAEHHEIGKLSLRPSVPFTVNDIYIINDLFNYNVFFEKNTSKRIETPNNLKGTFDCLVSLAAGDMVENNPVDIGLQGNNHYVIDISPTAIHKSMGIYKDRRHQYTQLDIFNKDAVSDFLKTCQGTRGMFVITNCFMYIVNALLYDVSLRLQFQNQLIRQLADDKIEWYVNIISADGISYSCVKASDIVDKKLDERFRSLPWIK